MFLVNNGLFFLHPLNWVQPKTSPFSTGDIIWVTYYVVSQLSQPIFLSFSYLNIALPNLVIDLCRALKMIQFFSRLFTKLIYSFVAIELLAFFINAKFHFYCSRELSVFGLKNIYTPYVKRIVFLFFVYIKRSVKKNRCVYECKWINFD